MEKIEKPWGYYEVLCVGPQYKVKRLGVNPGHKLSLQRHQHREEHWFVVEGTATITFGRDTLQLDVIRREGEDVDIEKLEWHRLSNCTKRPLTVIEIQRGDYLEEDDIERIEDDYDRI